MQNLISVFGKNDKVFMYKIIASHLQTPSVLNNWALHNSLRKITLHHDKNLRDMGLSPSINKRNLSKWIWY